MRITGTFMKVIDILRKDKVNRTIKLALSDSFHELGGKSWLVKLGKEDPKTYALLLARLIPAEVQAEITADVTHGLEQNLAARISEGRERVRLLNLERMTTGRTK